MLSLVFSITGRAILFISGWKVVKNGIDTIPEKCVVVAAPHTSNWDFPIARSAFEILKMPVRFTIKKEWMGFPMGWLMRELGAIGIDRNRTKGETSKSQVEAMADLFSRYPKLAILITPEGTRSKRTEWKTGFYHVARIAGVPLVLGYMDYKKKETGIGKIIHPGENMDADLKEIMEFYQQIHARFPDKFSVDTRYLS
jgi:1-acyl-sn-glycerol-3-phosphate acyltransferase